MRSSSGALRQARHDIGLSRDSGVSEPLGHERGRGSGVFLVAVNCESIDNEPKVGMAAERAHATRCWSRCHPLPSACKDLLLTHSTSKEFVMVGHLTDDVFRDGQGCGRCR